MAAGGETFFEVSVGGLFGSAGAGAEPWAVNGVADGGVRVTATELGMGAVAADGAGAVIEFGATPPAVVGIEVTNASDAGAGRSRSQAPPQKRLEINAADVAPRSAEQAARSSSYQFTTWVMSLDHDGLLHGDSVARKRGNGGSTNGGGDAAARGRARERRPVHDGVSGAAAVGERDGNPCNARRIAGLSAR